MNRTLLILAGILYEIITAVFIYRLWTGKNRPGTVECCFLSVVLLVPFFGWFVYLFLKPSPSEHGENVGGPWTNPGDSHNSGGHHH
jgi:hypothetical protein